MKESDSHFVVSTSSLASHFFAFAWPLVTYLLDHLHYLELCIAKVNNEETKCQAVLLFCFLASFVNLHKPSVVS